MSGQVIVLPAPEKGWVLSQGGSEIGRGDRLVELVGHRGDVLIGYPAANVTTFPVVMPSTDEGLHESMVFSQIEKRGLIGRAAAEGGEVLFDFAVVDHGEREDTFAVSVVSEIAGDLIVPGAAGYASSAALRSVQDGACALWKEHGRLVLAIYAGDEPVHLQVLSGVSEVGEMAAREINLILLGLNGDPAMADRMPTRLELDVPGVSREAVEAFSHVLTISADVRSVTSSLHSKARARLLPGAVTQARRKKRNRGRAGLVVAVTLAVYAVTISWLLIKSRNTTDEIESLKLQISMIEPDVEGIQQVDQRWAVLEPAFEKAWFPVVQLNWITSALPGSGVVVREFRTSGRGIRVRGQARDVQLANRLYEDLQVMEGFSSYDWSMPNPKVEKNNTATFEIEGKPKNEGNDS